MDPSLDWGNCGMVLENSEMDLEGCVMAWGAVLCAWRAVGRDPRAVGWDYKYSRTATASPQGPMILFYTYG